MTRTCVIIGASHAAAQLVISLRQEGWQDYLKKHLRYGGKVIGICGGYQMLGEQLRDPLGLENPHPDTQSSGFGLIPMETVLEKDKQLKQRQGILSFTTKSTDVTGYEIHSGVSRFSQNVMHFCVLENGEKEGYVSNDNQIIGTYLHGVFDHPDALHALLNWAGVKNAASFDYDQYRDSEINRLADSAEQHINIDALIKTCRAFQKNN